MSRQTCSDTKLSRTRVDHKCHQPNNNNITNSHMDINSRRRIRINRITNRNHNTNSSSNRPPNHTTSSPLPPTAPHPTTNHTATTPTMYSHRPSSRTK